MLTAAEAEAAVEEVDYQEETAGGAAVRASRWSLSNEFRKGSRKRKNNINDVNRLVIIPSIRSQFNARIGDFTLPPYDNNSSDRSNIRRVNSNSDRYNDGIFSLEELMMQDDQDVMYEWRKDDRLKKQLNSQLPTKEKLLLLSRGNSCNSVTEEQTHINAAAGSTAAAAAASFQKETVAIGGRRDRRRRRPRRAKGISRSQTQGFRNRNNHYNQKHQSATSAAFSSFHVSSTSMPDSSGFQRISSGDDFEYDDSDSITTCKKTNNNINTNNSCSSISSSSTSDSDIVEVLDNQWRPRRFKGSLLSYRPEIYGRSSPSAAAAAATVKTNQAYELVTHYDDDSKTRNALSSGEPAAAAAATYPNEGISQKLKNRNHNSINVVNNRKLYASIWMLIISRLAIGIVAVGVPILIACLLVFLPPSLFKPPHSQQSLAHRSPPVVLFSEDFSSSFSNLHSEYQEQQLGAPLRHLQASINGTVTVRAILNNMVRHPFNYFIAIWIVITVPLSFGFCCWMCAERSYQKVVAVSP